MKIEETNSESVEQPSRRAFLAKAGRYAAVTPAVITVLFSTSMEAGATGIGASGGGKKKRKRKWRKKKWWF